MDATAEPRPMAVASAPDEVDFGAIMELMTSKYTIDLVDRHVAAIRKLCKVCCNGFLLRHLEALVELLYLSVDRFAKGQDMAQALCDFTRVASQPFVSCKTSDMITYGHHLPAFVKGIVSVLTYTSPPDGPLMDEDKAQWEHKKNMLLGGGLNDFLFSPLFWEMILFDEHIFQRG